MDAAKTQQNDIRPIGLRAQFRGSEPLLNAFISIPDPAAASLVAGCGFDYVVLDAEHAPFSTDSLRHCIDAVARTEAAVVVRVASNAPHLIHQALDLGADGVQIPMVSTADEATAAVRAARFPPEGTRGVGASPASRYGSDAGSYSNGANARLAILIMVETAEGVSNVGSIAGTPGIDAVIVGRADLTAELGVSLDDVHVAKALTGAVGACKQVDVRVGTGCKVEEIPALADEGVSVFSCFFDGSSLRASAEDTAGDARSALDSRGRTSIRGSTRPNHLDPPGRESSESLRSDRRAG